MQTPSELKPASIDYANQAKQTEERRLEITAQIAILERQREKLLRKEQEYRRMEEEQKMAKEKRFTEQRQIRQEEVRVGITDHVIRGIRVIAGNDALLSNAVSRISNSQGDEEDLQLLRSTIFSELAGSEADFIRDIAQKVKVQTLYDDDDILKQFESNHSRPITPGVSQQQPVEGNESLVVTSSRARHTVDPDTLPSTKHHNEPAKTRRSTSVAKRAHDTSMDSQSSNAGIAKKARRSVTATPSRSKSFASDLERLSTQDHPLLPRLLCTVCKAPPKNPYLTTCLHLYCGSCLTGARKVTRDDPRSICHQPDCDQEFDDDATRFRLEQIEALKKRHKEQIDKQKADEVKNTDDSPADESLEGNVEAVKVELEDEETATLTGSEVDEAEIMARNH